MTFSASLPRTFFKYVSLNILSMIGLSLYILADTFFIAAGLGANGITALNLAIPVYSFVYSLGLLLGMGASTRFAVARGRGENEKANRIFTHVCIMGLFFGLLFSLTGVFFTDKIALALGADSATFEWAYVYMQTILYFAPAFLLNSILTCFVRNDHAPKLAMSAMLASSFSNIILDYVFIFPLKMEMFGAVFATCLAPLFSMAILASHFIRKKNTFSLVKTPFSLKTARRIFQTGLPTFITEFSSGFVILIFNFLLLSLSGNTAVAAYGIVANLALVATSIFSGIAQGIQPIVSFYHGAGEEKKVRSAFRYACITASAFGALFYLFGVLFADPVTALFNRDHDMLLAAMTKEGISLYFLAFLVMGINVIVTAFFACILRPAASFTLSLSRGFLAVIPCVLILSALFSLTGVWLSIPAAEGITLILSILFFTRYVKTEMGKTGLED